MRRKSCDNRFVGTVLGTGLGRQSERGKMIFCLCTIYHAPLPPQAFWFNDQIVLIPKAR